MSNHAQTLAALRAAKALEDRNRLDALAPQPKQPNAVVRFLERILGVR